MSAGDIWSSHDRTSDELGGGEEARVIVERASLQAEPELRPDEVVCSVTHLTYFKGLKSSPYLNKKGEVIW